MLTVSAKQHLEDTMYDHLATSIARDQTESLIANAAAGRRARAFRQARRDQRRAERQSHAVDRVRVVEPNGGHSTARDGAVKAAHIAARPMRSVQSWIAAGHL
jgi:hypothetical protein